MNKKTLVCALLSGGLAVMAIAGPAAADSNRCLEVRYIKVTHMVDSRTMVVTSMRDDQYKVRFTGACRVGGVYTWNHFVYTDLLVGRCLEARDVLPTSSLGPCFVESVTPIEKEHS